MKTDNLTGAALSYAVGLAMGFKPSEAPAVGKPASRQRELVAQGGQVLLMQGRLGAAERFEPEHQPEYQMKVLGELVAAGAVVKPFGQKYLVERDEFAIEEGENVVSQIDKSLALAILRAYVEMRLGEDVDVPVTLAL